MARKKPLVLGCISFDKQGDALTFFQRILQNYVPGEQLSSEDERYVGELFKRHPDYPTKVGSGVKYFEVMPKQYGSQCFCAVRTDGTKEGFSYKKCITQKKD